MKAISRWDGARGMVVMLTALCLTAASAPAPKPVIHRGAAALAGIPRLAEAVADGLTSDPTAVSWGSGRIDVFARGPDNALWHKSFEGQWSGWESLGGSLASGPDVASWSSGRLDVFARGTDNTLQHKSYAGQWSGWESLGGGLTSDPSAVAWGPGRLDVFARGGDNALWHISFENAWSGWESLGGALTSGPDAASWGSGRLDVFALGSDNTLYHKSYAGQWSGWESLGGGLTSDPSAVSWGSGRIDVFARGADNGLWHLSYANAWSGWESLGGGLSSGPDASSWGSGRLDVFARGLDNALYHMSYSGAWSAWEGLGAPTTTAPVTETATLATTPSGPTGPAPAGFTVSGTPMVAQLRWSATTGVTSYAIWRTDGSGGTTSQRTPNGFTGTVFPDTVPDPRLTYYYRLAVNYSNGTWGEVRGTFVSPAPTNPTSLTATSLAPGAFRLSWPAVAGAVKYRVDGATLPNTGGTMSSLYLYYNVINVPPGPQSWQVVALFPNGVADYNNPTKTSAISRVLPPHGAFLVKNNGVGNATYATVHAAQLCPDTKGSTTSYAICSIGQILQDYGTGYKLYSTYAGLEEVPYTNVTELGGARSTACKEGVAKGDRFTVCYTISGSSASVIVKGSKGTRFGTLQQRNGSYWDDMWGLVTTATLDGAGARYTPHACLSCHGGVYDPNTGLVEGATLLPIDPGLVGLTNRPAQEEAIRKINALILMSGASEAVAKYINGMYGGNALIAGAVAVPNYVPPGWATDANFYTGLVKKNCAMCHLAVRNGMDFLSVGNFLQFKDLTYNTVCKAKAMPHAEVPYGRFWTEDTGPIYVPGLLAARLGFSSCP